MAVGDQLSLVIRNDLAEIAAVRPRIVEFFEEHDLPESIRYRSELVIEEAVSNVVRHGYRDEARHEIEVTLRLESDRLEIEISDDGVAFDPTAHPEPAVPDDLEKSWPGGRGIYLVRQMADRVEYARVGGKNRLTVVLGLTGAA
jgi:anti-sigma regulatory factor (Ser/Thr protein kinase)